MSNFNLFNAIKVEYDDNYLPVENDTKDAVVTKEFIAILLASKSTDVTLEPQPNSRSDVWERFFRIYYKKVVTPFVACSTCLDKGIFKQDRNTGTTLLKNHKCFQRTSRGQKFITSFGKKVKLPINFDDDMATGLAEWCSMQFRPSTIVEDEGLRWMARKLLTIGHEFGPNVDLEEILPAASTVSNCLGTMSNLFKKKLEKRLKLYDGPKSFTADLWKCPATNYVYQMTKLHYFEIDETGKWVLCDRVIGFTPVDDRNTVEVIRKKANEIVEKFGMNFPSSTWITDNDNNMMKAFKDVKWFGCSVHDLSLAVEYAFKEQETCSSNEDNAMESNKILQLIITAKELVGYCMASKSIHEKLAEKGLELKRPIVGRWDSEFELLQSVKKALPELSNLLQNNQQRSTLCSLDATLLDHLVDVLWPLKMAAKLFSQTKVCTIHLKSAMKIKILNDLERCEDSIFSPELSSTEVYCMGDLKKFIANLKKAIKDYVKVTEYHNAATLLHPKFKNIMLAQMSTDDLNELKNFINFKLIRDFTGHLKENQKFNSTSADKSSSPEPSAKRFKADPEITEDEIFESLFVESKEHHVRDELASYIAEDSPRMDAIEYWSANTKYPKLREVAYFLFATPVSNVSSGRIGSALNDMLLERLSSLHPEMIERMLFYKSNFDLTAA